jgi:cytochrome b pre-mRNA-processing protein 3
MIVAQARSPAFYLSYGVPDTVAARLDMILLHLALLLQQLAASDATAAIGRPLFDRFYRDIDDNFREMGVGDLAVPKKIRQVAEAFHGRAKAYQGALVAGDDDALVSAVSRNVYGMPEPPLGAVRLAAYMRQAARGLAEQAPGAFARGEVRFPDPETIAPPKEPERPCA